jgi:hypothetical protein
VLDVDNNIKIAAPAATLGIRVLKNLSMIGLRLRTEGIGRASGENPGVHPAIAWE